MDVVRIFMFLLVIIVRYMSVCFFAIKDFFVFGGLMNSYISEEYLTYHFHKDSQNELFAVGYRDKVKTLKQLRTYPKQYHCATVLRGSATFLYDNLVHTLSMYGVYQHFPDLDFPQILEMSEDYVEYHICVGASVYEFLKDMGILYTQSPIFEMNPEVYLLYWMYAHVTTPMLKGDDDIFELFFNTQKLLRMIHKENRQQVIQTEQERFQTVLPMLAADFKHPVSYEKIAESFGLTYETFRKKFKVYMGMSPLQFRLSVKFQYAQRLLSEGWSITYVAQETGYADAFTFSRQFKKYIGKPPKAYTNKQNDHKSQTE